MPTTGDGLADETAGRRRRRLVDREVTDLGSALATTAGDVEARMAGDVTGSAAPSPRSEGPIVLGAGRSSLRRWQAGSAGVVRFNHRLAHHRRSDVVTVRHVDDRADRQSDGSRAGSLRLREPGPAGSGSFRPPFSGGNSARRSSR